MGLNSGSLYGNSRSRIQTRSFMSREDITDLLRANVVDLIGESVPAMTRSVHDVMKHVEVEPEHSNYRKRFRQSFVELQSLIDLLGKSVLETPSDFERCSKLARSIKSCLENFQASVTEINLDFFESKWAETSSSVLTFKYYTKKLEDIVPRVVHFLVGE